MSKYSITATATYQLALHLNPMQQNTENYTQFGPFPTMEVLRAFYDNEKVEQYKEEGPDRFGGGTKIYVKSFRKGGPLEWYNPLSEAEWIAPSYHGHGVHEILVNVEDVVRIGLAF